MPTLKELGMMLRVWPDPALRKRCEEITVFNKTVDNDIISMTAIMNTLEGLGLSANQIGILKRIVTWKIDGMEGYWINPRIIERSVETEPMMEGCLSFPGIFIPVERHKIVKAAYEDVDGVTHEVEYSGALAHTIQHEIDHLDGLVFIRGLSKLRQDIILRKMKKFNKKVDRIRSNYEQRKKQLGTTGLEDTAKALTGKSESEYDFSIDAESI